MHPVPVKEEGAQHAGPVGPGGNEAVRPEQTASIDLLEPLDESLVLGQAFFIREVLLLHPRIALGERLKLLQHAVESTLVSLRLWVRVEEAEALGALYNA